MPARLQRPGRAGGFYTSKPMSEVEIYQFMRRRLTFRDLTNLLPRHSHGCEHLLPNHTTTSQFQGSGYVQEVEGQRTAFEAPYGLYMVDASRDEKFLKDCAGELGKWARCRHENVLPFLGYAVYRDRFSIATLWMEHGNLRDYIGRHPEINRIELCAQVASGLQHIHQMGIVHSCLEARNIMVERGITSHSVPQIRIANLGHKHFDYRLNVNHQLQPDEERRRVAWKGPEADSCFPEPSGLEPPLDIFALGMTFLEIITGDDPRYIPILASLILAQNNVPPRPVCCLPDRRGGPNELWTLITQCCAHDPRARVKADYVVAAMGSIRRGNFAGLVRGRHDRRPGFPMCGYPPYGRMPTASR